MPRIEVVTIEDLKNSGKPATGYMWLENRFDGSVNVFWCDFVPRECQSCKLVKVCYTGIQVTDKLPEKNRWDLQT